MIAMRVHLFPSRTQKLSSFAPTILGGRLPGKIGNANITASTEKSGLFICLKHATGMFLNGRTILGLPRKIGNANIHRTRKCAVFFLLKYI